MRKVFILSMVMMFMMTGLAKAQGCGCGSIIGVLEIAPPLEIHFLSGGGLITMHVNQGGAQQKYYTCSCDDSGEEGYCIVFEWTVAPGTGWWQNTGIDGPGFYYQENMAAPCRWHNTTEGPQCGNAGC